MGNIFDEEFQEFIQCLNNAKVEYILVGGYAVISHGYYRSTGDLDIFVNRNPSNYSKITNAFRQFRMPLFDMSEDAFLDINKHDVFTFGRPPVAIEIMTQLKGLSFNQAFQCSERRLFDGLEIQILNVSGLIQAKNASARMKDLEDIHQLKLIQKEEE